MPEPASSSSRPLSILHVCSIKGRGGTGYMAGHLIRLLHEAGHRVYVAACAGSKIEERAREQGLSFLPGLELRRGFRPLALARDVTLLRRWIKDYRIDVLHAWHSIEYWSCFLASRGTGAKLARTRGLVTPVSAHVFNRYLHRQTAALFATCDRIRQNYADAGLGTNNVFALRDGVDTIRFCPSSDTAGIRASVGIPDGAFVIGNIGRLEEVKGQHTLVEALARLPERVHALFAGGGSLEEQLKRYARENGVDNRCHFLGVRSDIPEILRTCDAYVLCSVGSEGSSRATLEAMATRLPCVTTTVGMLPDIVHENETGLLFPPEDTAALVSQLRRLLDDQHLRESMAGNAFAMVTADWSEPAMVRQVESVYRKVVFAGA